MNLIMFYVIYLQFPQILREDIEFFLTTLNVNTKALSLRHYKQN